MSGPFNNQDDAATPLDEEEKEDLIPSYITTRGELNEAEQANILGADDWAFSSRRDVLNGNGRHARLATDLLLKTLGQPRFSWGIDGLVEAGETRQRYVMALRAADDHDFVPLLKFVRS